MRQRNAARRYSKAALGSAGPTPRESPLSALDSELQRRKLRDQSLEQAFAKGRVPRCDRCRRPMVYRRNAKSGRSFFGCSGCPNAGQRSLWLGANVHKRPRR